MNIQKVIFKNQLMNILKLLIFMNQVMLFKNF